MKVLIVGASGATGRLVVDQLLAQDIEVRAIVRSLDTLADHPNLEKIQASVYEVAAAEMVEHVRDCSAVISCLGHNLTFKGMFGHPRSLVTNVLACMCDAIKLNNGDDAVKVILMNTSGNSNRDIPESVPVSQRMVVGIIRALLPPHVDNENAADYLRTEVGQDDAFIQWVAVRPDALIDESAVTAYDVHESPIRNPIFDSGQTSRINVANFMAQLIADESKWLKWKGRMPVIYNKHQPK